jgi:hypothetical protein
LGNPVLQKQAGPKELSSGYGTAAKFQSQSTLQRPKRRGHAVSITFYSLSGVPWSTALPSLKFLKRLIRSSEIYRVTTHKGPLRAREERLLGSNVQASVGNSVSPYLSQTKEIVMIRLSSSKFRVLAAMVLLMPIWSSHISAQNTSKATTIISDAQAQALMQILAAQQSGGAALTPAQTQMLMQYLLSKNGTSAASSALGAAQAQMLLQNAAAQGMATQGRGLSAGKALSGQTPAASMPAAATSAAPPAPAATPGDKKPGIVRIGIAMPKAQLGQSAQGPSAGEPVRVMLAQYLTGPTVETISIAALLPDQIEAEAKSKQCDFLVYSSLSQKKQAGNMGFLKNASSLANMIPMVAMTNSVSAIATSSASAAASQAAGLSSGIKAKSDVVLEYHMNAVGNTSPVLNTTLDAKATADGEDVITPLVEKEATQIMAEVSKKQ